jgi:2-phospho-L-lactate/phosphoenolpyruvate guanylyltransferase
MRLPRGDPRCLMQSKHMRGEPAVIIPCKGLASGKSRLAPVLSRDARARLCAKLLQQTLDTALALVPHDKVWLVTSDAEALGIAEGRGVSVVADPGGGLNAALEVARRAVFDHDDRIAGLLVLPIDLPRLDQAALGDVLTGGADVAIAGDRAGAGTNVLHLSGAAARHLPFSYGEGSFQRHCDLARRAGHTLRIVANDVLAIDLDEPQDWHELHATRPEQRLSAAMAE